MRTQRFFACAFAAWCVIAVTGCNSRVIEVSMTVLDFEDDKSLLQFEVYNTNPKRDTLTISIEASAPWMQLSHREITSAAPPTENGPFDVRVVQVQLDRASLARYHAEGEIRLNAPRAKKRVILVRAAPPYEAIHLSATAMDFGVTESNKSVELTNVNTAMARLNVRVVPDQPWIDVVREITVYGARTVLVGVRRDLLSPGQHEGHILFEAEGFVPQMLAVSAFQPYQAIKTSLDSLDFGRNTWPMLMYAWNSNPDFDPLEVSIIPSHEWIEVRPDSFVCNTASLESDPALVYDKHQISVSINRNRLPAGNYEGQLRFEADTDHVAPKIVRVKVEQRQSPPGWDSGFHIRDVVPGHQEPYLIEFAFGLGDPSGNGLVAEPAQFDVRVFENGDNVSAIESVRPVFRRAAEKQMRVDIILDYSIAMRERPDMMAAMEALVTTQFLPAMSADTLVGLSFFHRDDIVPVRLVPFTNDHALVAREVLNIRNRHIGAFSSGSRLRDAVYASARLFDPDTAASEERLILLVAGTEGISSRISLRDAVDEAVSRRVSIYTVSMLGDVNGSAEMLNLAERTRGMYLPGGAADEMADVIASLIGRLEAHYVLRWGTRKRSAIALTPAFELAIGEHQARYSGQSFFLPLIAGDVLRGRLRLVGASSDEQVSLLVRAEYVPQDIRRIRLLLDTAPEAIWPIAATDGGIIEHWAVDTTTDEESNVTVIELTSFDGTPLPFATFGGLLRLDFDETPGVPIGIAVDNDISDYEDGGQYFILESESNGSKFVVLE